MTARIAILFEFPTLNGGELSMLGVLSRLRGVDVIALAPPEGPLGDRLRNLGVTVEPFVVREGGRKRPLPELLDELGGTIRRRQPTILHANSLSMSRMTGALKGRAGVRCTGHLRDIVRLSRAAVDDLNRNNRLVAVSNATRDFHVAQGLDPLRVQTIYNGVDLDRFSPRERSGALRREFGLPDEARLIGTIGQICLRKGQDLLPSVAEQLPCAAKQIHFCLVGERYSEKPESVEFDATLTRRFEEIGLSRHFHRLGYRADVPQLLNEFDVLLHPARQEPLGRVLLEAAASGCPIVATDVGGTEEIVRDGESALLFNAGDAATAARSVDRVLADDTLATFLADAARSVATDRFRLDRAASRLIELWA